MKIAPTPEKEAETKDEKAQPDTKKEKGTNDEVADAAFRRYQQDFRTNSTVMDVLDQAGL